MTFLSVVRVLPSEERIEGSINGLHCVIEGTHVTFVSMERKGSAKYDLNEAR